MRNVALALPLAAALVGCAGSETARPGATIGPSLRPDTLVLFDAQGLGLLPPAPLVLGPPSDGHGASGVRLLVGGDGVRRPDDGDTGGTHPRVVPVVVASRQIAYVWRARSNAPETTAPISENMLDETVAGEPCTLHFLAAVRLARGESAAVTASPWGLVEIPAIGEGGALALDPLPRRAGRALLLAERNADTWFRLDDARGTTGRLPLSPDRAHALVLFGGPDGETFRVRVSGGYEGGAWEPIVADDGIAESHWGLLSSPSERRIKILDLDRDPRELGAARVVYHVGAEPYSKDAGAHLGDPKAGGVRWSEFVIEINGGIGYRAPLDEAARAGWNTAPIPVDRLRRGRNEIAFRVDGNDFVYLSVDESSTGRSGYEIEGRRDMLRLRPGRDLSGEYLVRLEVR